MEAHSGGGLPWAPTPVIVLLFYGCVRKNPHLPTHKIPPPSPAHLSSPGAGSWCPSSPPTFSKSTEEKQATLLQAPEHGICVSQN